MQIHQNDLHIKIKTIIKKHLGTESGAHMRRIPHIGSNFAEICSLSKFTGTTQTPPPLVPSLSWQTMQPSNLVKGLTP